MYWSEIGWVLWLYLGAIGFFYSIVRHSMVLSMTLSYIQLLITYDSLERSYFVELTASPDEETVVDAIAGVTVSDL